MAPAGPARPFPDGRGRQVTVLLSDGRDGAEPSPAMAPRGPGPGPLHGPGVGAHDQRRSVWHLGKRDFLAVKTEIL